MRFVGRYYEVLKIWKKYIEQKEDMNLSELEEAQSRAAILWRREGLLNGPPLADSDSEALDIMFHKFFFHLSFGEVQVPHKAQPIQSGCDR